MIESDALKEIHFWKSKLFKVSTRGTRRSRCRISEFVISGTNCCQHMRHLLNIFLSPTSNIFLCKGQMCKQIGNIPYLSRWSLPTGFANVTGWPQPAFQELAFKLASTLLSLKLDTLPQMGTTTHPTQNWTSVCNSIQLRTDLLAFVASELKVFPSKLLDSSLMLKRSDESF